MEIHSRAFQGCDSLESIDLPPLVERLTGMSLAKCRLSQVGFDPDNRNYHSRGAFVLTRENTTVVRYLGSDSDIEIPDDVEVIGSACFYDCPGLSSVSFGPGSKLCRIRDDAFSECVCLESISVPFGVEALERGCFDGCQSLVSVTFAPGAILREMGAAISNDCGGLKSITIPSSVEVIGESCFSDCESLETVSFPADSKVVQFEPWTFLRCCALKAICIPSSIVLIGHQCFGECFALSSLTFASPCRIRSLLDLPPYSPAEIAIPDTVENLCFASCANKSCLLTLIFGRESRLSHVQASCNARLQLYRGFLQISAPSLKVLRRLMEFEDA
jgi:hypothetical protein